MKMKKLFLAGILALGMTCTAGMGTVYGAVTDGKVLVSGLDTSSDYYIFQDSDTRELTEQEISALTDAQKQMAINEIYARRGRKFVLTEVQEYFNGKSWYRGIIEASQFDESVFSSIESKNISKLLTTTDYYFYDSCSAYLTDDDIKGYTKDELQLAINEIYARHGRLFTTAKYRDYFNGKAWYIGNIKPEDFDESILNSYENANIAKLSERIKALEAQENSVIDDFAGEYVLDKTGVGAILDVSVYTDNSPSRAAVGDEVASVGASLNIGSGGISFSQSYLIKEGVNAYSMRGGDLNGAILTVSRGKITISYSSAFDGDYQQTAKYSS